MSEGQTQINPDHYCPHGVLKRWKQCEPCLFPNGDMEAQRINRIEELESQVRSKEAELKEAREIMQKIVDSTHDFDNFADPDFVAEAKDFLSRTPGTTEGKR